MVYHGHTFTSKIPFREVVSTLGKYAFKVGHPSPAAGCCGWPSAGGGDVAAIQGSDGSLEGGAVLGLTHLVLQQV